MTDGKHTRTLWLVAAVLIIAGIALSVISFRQMKSLAQVAASRAADARAVEALRAEMLAGASAVDFFNALPVKQPADLETVVAANLKDARASVSAESVSDAGAGWTLVSRTVSVPDISPGDALTMATAAGAQNPPWRLVKFSISATGSTPGRGNVAMTFEALRK